MPRVPPMPRASRRPAWCSACEMKARCFVHPRWVLWCSCFARAAPTGTRRSTRTPRRSGLQICFALEQHLQADLNDSLVVFDDLRNLSELRGIDIVVRQPEIDAVEDVEGLRTELQADPIIHSRHLQQPEIGIEVSRSAQDVGSRVTECPGRTVCKLGRVEPLPNHLAVRAVVAQLRGATADKVRAIGAAP